MDAANAAARTLALVRKMNTVCTRFTSVRTREKSSAHGSESSPPSYPRRHTRSNAIGAISRRRLLVPVLTHCCWMTSSIQAEETRLQARVALLPTWRRGRRISISGGHKTGIRASSKIAAAAAAADKKREEEEEQHAAEEGVGGYRFQRHHKNVGATQDWGAADRSGGNNGNRRRSQSRHGTNGRCECEDATAAVPATTPS